MFKLDLGDHKTRRRNIIWAQALTLCFFFFLFYIDSLLWVRRLGMNYCERAQDKNYCERAQDKILWNYNGIATFIKSRTAQGVAGLCLTHKYVWIQKFLLRTYYTSIIVYVNPIHTDHPVDLFFGSHHSWFLWLTSVN